MDPNAAAGRARLLRTMAHPIRLLILEELARGMKCVNDMREILGVPQPNVSQHLSLLKKLGLVDSYKDGPSRCYQLAHPEMVRRLLVWLSRSSETIAVHESRRHDPKRKGGSSTRLKRKRAVPPCD
ncbi:MAG: winged helix-turn-helix transcriptional regulator [Vicinamibacteria bacterium]|nr:winged helix-turn-helix transcriptional regulator [Vicinamibacteria bacterium]